MKRLKYLFMALIMVTCLVGSSVPASASSYSTGKAVIPFYNQNPYDSNQFTVSNITDSPINVTVTLYNLDGTLVTDDGNPNTGRVISATPSNTLNYNDCLSDATLTFTLNAHNTAVFWATNTTTTELYGGYGVIKWDQNSTALQGLVAYSFALYKNGNTYIRNTNPINNGLPF